MKFRANQSGFNHSLCVAIMLACFGCGEVSVSSDSGNINEGSGDNGSTFDEHTLVTNIVDNVITPTFAHFKTATQSQVTAISAYCTALENDSESAEITQPQHLWRQTMAAWQQAEMMQIGPLSRNDNFLRNTLYSWPVTSYCAIDQDTITSRNNDEFNVSTRTFQRKGIDALEYLLFNESTAHSCTAFGTAPAEWNSLSYDEIRLARCEFAVKVAENLNEEASNLLSRWTDEDEPDNGYSLKNAGDSGIHESVNRITDAIFYLDTMTKSAKLGVPLGIKLNDCGGLVCPQNLESTLSGNSLSNIENNLLALTYLLQGGIDNQGVGFSEYLQSVGESDVSESLEGRLAESLAKIRAIDSPLETVISSDTVAVTEIHGDIEDVSRILKTDFIEKLNLSLPSTAAGDGD